MSLLKAYRINDELWYHNVIFLYKSNYIPFVFCGLHGLR